MGIKTIILNPFQKFSEKQLIAFGISATVIGGLLSLLFNGRFDGVLDLHFTEKTTIATTALDLIISFSILASILFLFGKIINKKTRLIDILATCFISKIPFFFLLFFNINNKMFLVTENLMKMVSTNKPTNFETPDIIFLMSSGITTFACLIWSIALLFNGFRTATNLKETKHILLFALAIILAEVASKIIILNLNY